MAASQVFVVVLVVIFVGFICLLVSLRQSHSVKPEYDDDDDDDNSNITDVLVDLSKPYVTPWRCDPCPLTSLRDKFCDPESFVVLCAVTGLTSSYGRRNQLFTIKLVSRLKQFPDVNESSIVTDSSILLRVLYDFCSANLFPGRHYILTGRLNRSGMAVVTSCDVAIDLNAISHEKQQSLFGFFQPVLRC